MKIFPHTAVGEGEGEPGQVLDAGEGGLVVACGAGSLRLVEVQPDGARRMHAREFVRGARIGHGTKLG